MNSVMATDIAHPIGFLAGLVVYAYLLAMVLRDRGAPNPLGRPAEGLWYEHLRLPLGIAVLGLLWNAASLATVVFSDVFGRRQPVVLALLATTALSSLPALAMHSVWQTAEVATRRRVGLLTVAGYALSATAAAMNMLAAWSGKPVPAAGAWQLLTWGFLAVFVLLLLGMTAKALAEHGGIVLVFLALCSVVALPLSHHTDDRLPWWLDFMGHHASLPIAVAVLYRDYRFAFVDHFLKRILSFLLLVGISIGLYVVAVLPLLQNGDGKAVSAALSGLIISLWMATAMAYPWVHQYVAGAFDVLVLRRPDYQELRLQLAQRVNERETAEAVLGELCQSLERALRSKEVGWKRSPGVTSASHPSNGSGASEPPAAPGPNDIAGPIRTPEGGLSVVVPTLESPRCVLTIAPRENGCRLLSEELTLVEAAALLAARRIDALRTSHERCETALREQEMQKLATEAELKALRAQINPHFLFNALNTIGYLIEVAPARASSTLNDLTSLLRGMLRRMEGSFTTLGEELELIRSYLDIEQARFEERLSVRINVPESLRGLHVPALILQPIVENAVKHGIQPSLDGGSITIAGRMAPDLRRPAGHHGHGLPILTLEVSDTGVGAADEQWRQGRRKGIGLANVEQRLRGHYGDGASITMASEPGVGTTVELRVPVREPVAQTAVLVATATRSGER